MYLMPLHLKVVKIVNFTLYVFYHNLIMCVCVCVCVCVHIPLKENRKREKNKERKKSLGLVVLKKAFDLAGNTG